MKPNEIRELSTEELQRKGDDLTQEFFNLRFQHGVGQLENTAILKQTKKDIARVKTILKEKQQSESESSE